MKLKIKRSLLNYILCDYDQPEAEWDWYGKYYDQYQNGKVEGAYITLDLTEGAKDWLIYIIKDDSHPSGRKLDTYDEMEASEKRAITKFIKEAKEFLTEH